MSNFFYTLSLHDALPICVGRVSRVGPSPEEEAVGRWGHAIQAEALDLGARPIQPMQAGRGPAVPDERAGRRWLNRRRRDRKSTRLNSSHVESSYAVFCMK